MELAPVILFTYNRPSHTKITLQSLSEQEYACESDLIIFSDGPKDHSDIKETSKIREVRGIIREISGFRKVRIIERQENYGLSRSVINGINQVFESYDKIIVIEDDLMFSKGFLKFMNQGLKNYKEFPNVFQVNAYSWPVKKINKTKSSFFLPITASQGWGTWKENWFKIDFEAKGYEKLKEDKRLRRKFNMDGHFPLSEMLFNQMETDKVDSWAIRFMYSIFLQNGLALFPDKSLVRNTGWDGSGRHSSPKNPYKDPSWDPDYSILFFPEKAEISKKYKYIKKYLARTRNIEPNILKRYLKSRINLLRKN